MNGRKWRRWLAIGAASVMVAPITGYLTMAVVMGLLLRGEQGHLGLLGPAFALLGAGGLLGAGLTAWLLARKFPPPPEDDR